MTTATLRRRGRPPLPAAGYGFRTVAPMEWRKLRTVRSTWYILAVFAASMIGLAVLALSHENYAQLSAAGRASFDPTHDCFIGLVLGQLLAGALGVLAITTEFSSGMIRATFAAVPRPPARARREGGRARRRHAGGRARSPPSRRSAPARRRCRPRPRTPRSASPACCARC